MSAHEAPAVGVTTAQGNFNGSTNTIARTTAAHKWQRFLRAILDHPHTSRELEREPVFDHVAHSTAAELRRKGVALHTEIIEIAGYAGLPARVARYSIDPSGIEFARKLLERR